jgi:hypothetical protein
MDRDTWLTRILDAVRDLADERYQESESGCAPRVPRSIRAPKRSFGSLTATISALSSPRLQRYAARAHSSGGEAARIASPAWRRMRKLAHATLETSAAPAANP